MVLSSETFNQSVRTEYSEAVNARYTFQPLWVSGDTNCLYYETQGDVEVPEKSEGSLRDAYV